MTKYKILVTDDDPLVVEATERLLQSAGYVVGTASGGNEAIELVRANPTGYALVLLDYRLQDRDASSTIQALREVAPELFILIYSGDPSRDAVQSTWQAGAVGFVEKHHSPQALLDTVRNWYRKFEATVSVVPTYQASLNAFGLVGRSEALSQIVGKIEKYRKVNSSVLILGETGTGRELIARGLHAQGEASFTSFNCAVYRDNPEQLEIELFGLFEAARGGTVFLDDLQLLPLKVQPKLLKLIQDRKVRLVSAARPDLAERCERGEFLSELQHRVGMLTITVPPLRQRPEDIEPMVAYFCERFRRETGEHKHFLLRTLKYLEAYDWPGNVRELENTVWQILTDCPGNRIAPEHLDAKFFQPQDSLPDSYEEFARRQEGFERDYVSRVLQASRNKSDAARRMKISPTTLHSVMKRIGLVP